MAKILAIAAMEKILKKAGDIRVSDPAKEELRIILEEEGERIAKDAMKYAMHAGRRTIKAEDVKLAKNSKD